jgi:hypothetical protein
MSTGRIGLQFSLSNFPVEGDFDTRINIREDFNFIRYGSSFGLRNVGISFLESDPLNVFDNVVIQDLTSSVAENSPLKFSETTYFSQLISIPDASFLMTDVFKTTSLGETVPLYYRHDLTAYSTISSIEILDGNFNPVNKDLYLYADEEVVLGEPRKSIYTNLRPEYDGRNEIYTVYYARFKDDTTGAFITELLNPKVFYEAATFGTSALERAYSISPEEGGNSSITIYFDSKSYSPTPLSGSHRYSIKITKDNRIQVLTPTDLPSTEKWYLRINPGEFYKGTVDGDARYYVPEYENQLFSPVAPFKLLVEQVGKIITNRMIHVAPGPIANLGTAGFYLYIIVKDKFNNTIRALTNDPTSSAYITPSGESTDIFFELDAVQSVSEDSGFVRLNTDIPTDASVYVTYRYIEDYYSYRGVSVNSTINPDILSNRILVYARPEFTQYDISGNPTPESTLSKTIFHLLIDEGDLILDANESEQFKTVTGTSTGGGTAYLTDTTLSTTTDFYTGYELEILSGNNAGRRLEITAYSTTTQRLTVAEDFVSAMVAGVEYRINKKLSDYNYTDPVSTTTFNYIGWLTDYIGSPNQYLLLSDVFAIQTLAPKDINRTDIRIRGGGVQERELTGALSLQDQTQWYWDVGYWDGQPYPGMGAMLVEIPRSILDEVGGDFTKEQVQEVVERHIGNGIYPIIKYYDRSTTITDVQPKDQCITLTWRDVEAGSYNIYLGQNPDQLTLYRSVAGIITTLDITDLDNNEVYYMQVESVVDGVAQLPSRLAFAIPFVPSEAVNTATYGVTVYSEGVYNSG